MLSKLFQIIAKIFWIAIYGVKEVAATVFYILGAAIVVSGVWSIGVLTVKLALIGPVVLAILAALAILALYGAYLNWQALKDDELDDIVNLAIMHLVGLFGGFVQFIRFLLRKDGDS